MVKGNIMKTIVSIVVIIVLVVFIVNIDKFVSPKTPRISEDKTKLLTERATKDYGECFDKDPSTVVFLYSDSCPYCNKMKPLIEELESEGYNFYWAESSDSEAREIIGNCFSELVGGYVPQFICPATGEEQTGAMSKDNLREFADDCI